MFFINNNYVQDLCVCIIVSAVADSDYTVTSSNLMFPVGSAAGAMQCIHVIIMDNSISEDNETFVVELRVLTSDVMEGNTTTTITIIDDDCEHCKSVIQNV